MIKTHAKVPVLCPECKSQMVRLYSTINGSYDPEMRPVICCKNEECGQYLVKFHEPTIHLVRA